MSDFLFFLITAQINFTTIMQLYHVIIYTYMCIVT